MQYITAKYKVGSMLLGLLISIFIFNLIILLSVKWHQQHLYQAQKQYQINQALQIAENQYNLNLLNLACRTNIQQNNLHFQINCQTNNEIRVQYPLGILVIKV